MTGAAGAARGGGGLTARWNAASEAQRALAVGALATLLLIGLDALVRDVPQPRGDDEIYARMADHPFDPHTFPFAYRILLPWVVHVLPFGHSFSFSLLAWLCSGAAGGVLYLLLRRCGALSALSAALGLTLAVCPPLLVLSLRQGHNTDAVTTLLMVLATLLIVERRPRALAVTLVVLALTRESAMFLIPFTYAVWAARPFDAPVLRRVLILSAPAIAVYVALRIGIPTVGRSAVSGYGSVFADRWDVLQQGLSQPFTEARRLFIDFGPLWLAAPFALRDLPLARRGLVLIAPLLVSMTFALDWGRVMFLAAPLFYVAAAHAVRDRPRLQVAMVGGWVVVIVVYAVYMQVHGIDNILGGNLPPFPVR